MKIPTLQEINAEIERRKYKRSKLYRLENLYQIVDKSNQAIIFKMNAEQKDIYNKTWDESDIMINSPKILKSRQIGVSTLFVLCYLDDALNNPNLNVYIQSHKDDSIEKIFRIVRFAYDHLPDNCRPSLKDRKSVV